LSKQIVWQRWCPTCQSVVGHRRHRGTINTIDCCVCGHGIPLIKMGLSGGFLKDIYDSSKEKKLELVIVSIIYFSTFYGIGLYLHKFDSMTELIANCGAVTVMMIIPYSMLRTWIFHC